MRSNRHGNQFQVEEIKNTFSTWRHRSVFSRFAGAFSAARSTCVRIRLFLIQLNSIPCLYQYCDWCECELSASPPASNRSWAYSNFICSSDAPDKRSPLEHGELPSNGKRMSEGPREAEVDRSQIVEKKLAHSQGATRTIIHRKWFPFVVWELCTNACK